MKFLTRFYDRCFGWTHPLQSLILFLIRLIWGVKFIVTGWHKLNNIPATTEFFNSLGISNPETMAYTVGGIEAVCGFLILIGFLSRLAALPLVGVMIGAYVTAYPEVSKSILSNFDAFTKEDPYLFLFASLIVLAFGPGKLSLDYLIRRKTGG